MNVKRFFAHNSREALRQVKDALGPDAIVLSNRAVDGGVEILAAPPESLDVFDQYADDSPDFSVPDEGDFNLTLSPAAMRTRRGDAAYGVGAPTGRSIDTDPAQGGRAASAKARRAPEMRTSTRGAQTARTSGPAPEPRVLARPISRNAEPEHQTDEHPARKTTYMLPEPQHATLRTAAQEHAASQATAPSGQDSQAVDTLLAEFKAFRELMEQHLGGLAWKDFSAEHPQRAVVLGELLDAGFSAHLARRLVMGVSGGSDLERARLDVREALSKSLDLGDSDADLFDRGGVYALVGPTGVGKTTTTAKLAARFVARHGAHRMALLTTDNYRIGAHEQLRIYGRILGVETYPVKDAAHLKEVLDELKDRKLILIDTVGMSQRDRRMDAQAEMLGACGTDIRRLLLLNATANGDTLDEVVRSYSGPGIHAAILTKVDEATCLGASLDVLVRHRIRMAYIANGQRVPEDLHLPNRAYVLHRSMKARKEESPFHLGQVERGATLTASLGLDLLAKDDAHA